MAHQEQIDFCTKVRSKFPHLFYKRKVLDVGSLDINGNNRYLFFFSDICGIDVGSGKNVDFVSSAHEFPAEDSSYDFIVSTECFEHDMFYEKSLLSIIRMLASGGMFMFTCATEGRPEHGTKRTTPENAPLLPDDNEWSNYYKNLTEQDIRNVFDVDAIFSEYAFEVNDVAHDLYFWGIKK